MDESLKILKAKNVHWKSVNGEAVLLHFSSGDYYALDPVGTFLWSKIVAGVSDFEGLLNCLEDEYNCGKEEAASDLKEFCNKLIAEKLLDVKASNI